MKNSFVILTAGAPIMGAGLLFVTGAAAQDEPWDRTETAGEKRAETGTVSATGTVFSVEPEALSLKVEGSPTPLLFQYDASTPYVDEQDKPVSTELIRKDLPITVHYVTEGETMKAKKVVISRKMAIGEKEGSEAEQREAAQREVEEAERVKATAPGVRQVSSGILTGVEQVITVRSSGGETPERYTINQLTRLTNGDGQPVPPQAVESGLPVTVHYIQEGGQKVASRIVVQGAAPLPGGDARSSGDAGEGQASSGGAEGRGTGNGGRVRNTPRNNAGGADLIGNGLGGTVVVPGGPPLGTPVPDAGNGKAGNNAQGKQGNAANGTNRNNGQANGGNAGNNPQGQQANDGKGTPSDGNGNNNNKDDKDNSDRAGDRSGTNNNNTGRAGDTNTGRAGDTNTGRAGDKNQGGNRSGGTGGAASGGSGGGAASGGADGGAASGGGGAGGK